MVALKYLNTLKFVLNGTLDVGVCFSPLRHPELQMQELHRGELRLVIKKSHPVLKKISLTKPDLSVLSKYPAIIHKGTPGVDVCEDHPEFTKNRIKCQITNYFESDELAVNTISRGESWSLLPDLVAAEHQSKLALVPTPKNWNAPYTISAVFRKARAHNPVVESFLNCLAEQFR